MTCEFCLKETISMAEMIDATIDVTITANGAKGLRARMRSRHVMVCHSCYARLPFWQLASGVEPGSHLYPLPPSPPAGQGA